MQHALLSPSASHRWLICPGSVLANKNKPWEQSEHALEGTSAHALLEVALVLGVDPERFVGSVLDSGHHTITEEMAHNTGFALDYVRQYLALNPRATLHIEEPVMIGSAIGTTDETCWGTPDITLDNYPEELVVIDYKNGKGIVVNVKGNTQVKLYTVGRAIARGRRYRRYRQVVIQPRVPGRKPVQEHTFSHKELTAWVERDVKPAVQIALSNDAPRVAGRHCHYCHADGKCKAQFELVQAAAKEEFMKNPKELTPAEIGRALDILDTVTRIGAKIKEQAVAQAHAGVQIPGYAADWTNQQRRWADEEKANTLLTRLGLSEKRDRYTVELLSPAQAEKVLKERKLWPKSKRGEGKPPDPLEPVLTYTESKPSIRKLPPAQ